MRSALLLCCLLVEAPADRRRLAAYNYVEFDKLTASDAAWNDEFGRSVAIDGDTVVIGTSWGEAAYVFRMTDGGATYDQVAKLTAGDAASRDKFGYSVAIAGDTVVVGAYNDGYTGHSNDGSGSAYVFRTSDGGATYAQVAKLTASDAAWNDYFGWSVAIDGNTVVVGAYFKNSYRGAVYLFRTTDSGATYGQVAKLTAADAAAYDYFGGSVAIDGDTVVVGAYYDGNTGRYNSDGLGSAYAFRTTDGGATYGQVAKLTAADAAAGDRFGWSVAIDGDTIVIGAYGDYSYRGAVYVFRTAGGATYGQVDKLTASDAAWNDEFGRSVAIAGGTIVVGACWDDDAGSKSGSAYVFRTTDGGATYDQVAKLTASDAAADDRFGSSVAIDGDTIVVGAYGDDGAGTRSGSAYVSSLPAPTAQPTAQPTTAQPTSQPTTAQPTTAQPTAQPTTAQPTAQPTKQVDVLAPWEIALISIACLVFGVGCFVCLLRMRISRPSAKTSPTVPEIETPPILRTTSVLPMGTVEAVQAPDADAAPPILGEVVAHSSVLSVSN